MRGLSWTSAHDRTHEPVDPSIGAIADAELSLQGRYIMSDLADGLFILGRDVLHQPRLQVVDLSTPSVIAGLLGHRVERLAAEPADDDRMGEPPEGKDGGICAGISGDRPHLTK